MRTAGGSCLDGHIQDANLDERDAHSQTPLLRGSATRSTSVLKRTCLFFQDWWLWELVSAGLAVLAVIVIINILVVFDQSSLPDWPSVFTVRSIFILDANLRLKSCVDKFSHLLPCNDSEDFHYVGCWSLNIAIKMVMVPSGQASSS